MAMAPPRRPPTASFSPLEAGADEPGAPADPVAEAPPPTAPVMGAVMVAPASAAEEAADAAASGLDSVLARTASIKWTVRQRNQQEYATMTDPTLTDTTDDRDVSPDDAGCEEGGKVSKLVNRGEHSSRLPIETLPDMTKTPVALEENDTVGMQQVSIASCRLLSK